MQTSGSFYSSGSQRTISSRVSYVYFIKQRNRENKVAWVGGGGKTRQRTGTGPERGGCINSSSIIRSSFSATYVSPVSCLLKDSQYLQMSSSIRLVLCNTTLTQPRTHVPVCRVKTEVWSDHNHLLALPSPFQVMCCARRFPPCPPPLPHPSILGCYFSSMTHCTVCVPPSPVPCYSCIHLSIWLNESYYFLK